MAVPGLGQKSLEEVRSRLADKGWTLGGDEPARRRGRRGPARRRIVSDEPETALLGGDLFDAGDVLDDEYRS